MATDVAAVAEAVARYRLGLGAQRFRGRAGDRRGHGVGSSQEFFDFRDYVPGDDLRHLDWRGYARTEQLRIRLHQEEVAPHVDVLLDTSVSMASTPAKEQAVHDLVGALVGWSERQGSRARVLALAGGPLDPSRVAFDGAATAPAVPALPLRTGGVRILVTDGLWPDAAGTFLRRVLSSAARFFALQVLDPWELEPDAAGAMTLVDCETGIRREVHLDARTVAAYQGRLDRLCDTLRTEVVGHGGLYARVTAAPLAAMCEHDLLPSGAIEPQ
ncbi:MAG: DUF58 domain-containing protein [bacterium]|nr:DUF58 domain-containing protein [bacterium]